MLRSLKLRNSSLVSITRVRAHHRDVCGVGSLFFVPSWTWNFYPITIQQRRLNHGGQGNAAHVIHRGSSPLLDSTIGQLLGDAAKKWPDQECLVSLHQNVKLSLSDLVDRADRLAAGLMKLGMKRGDRLGIWGPNDVEWLIAFFCSARAGFISVMINPTFQMNELVYILQKVGVKAVVSPANFKRNDYPAMLLKAKQFCPTLEHVIIYSKDHVTGTHRFSDVEALPSKIEVERIAAEQDQISCLSGSNLQFTSGTTGKPKATLVSHKSLLNNSRLAVLRAGYTPGQRICLVLPFFHAFALVMGIMAMLHRGVTLVMPDRWFNSVKACETILREKCNILMGTPTMWIHMLDAKQQLQSPPMTLSCAVTGGSPMAPELFKRIREAFNFNNLKTIYGLTEVTCCIFSSLPNEDHELTDTTIGHVMDHVEVMVVDENGKAVSFGTPGELWVRGYCNMMRYWDDEENTRKTITEDGWLKTGDQFILRSNGYGHVVGRLKDMLIRGGENLFPKEIEDILMTHPQVLEAQVIGAYDKVNGEEVCACVRLRTGSSLTKEELRKYCGGLMAPFKVPRYIIFVDGYPTTASGKVQKYLLKQELERKGIIPDDPNSNRVNY
ncbi:acyl-CoA synthetase family member 2 [Xylocopa sonorina]|uniref:acyl-CoA synthetase family member 2 n=1 Tax=Xylocopa sonorina TaxID=1818115 RepID=UPI00403AA100